jgi:arylsulfatase A-like enzyme
MCASYMADEAANGAVAFPLPIGRTSPDQDGISEVTPLCYTVGALRLSLVLGAVVTATLVGAIEAASVAHAADIPIFRLVLAGAVVAASAGLLFGFLAALISWICAVPVAAFGSVRSQRRRVLTRHPPDLHAHYASGWAFWTVLLLFLVCVAALLRALWDHSDDGVARVLALLGIGLLGVTGKMLHDVLRVRFRRVAAWLDSAGRLPWPRSTRMRVLVWILSPMCAVFGPILYRYQNALGVFSLLFAASIFAVVAWFLGSLIDRASLLMQRVALGGVLVGLLIAVPLLDRTPTAWANVERGPVGKTSLTVMRWVTDVDRDGFSSLFGGADCAPWDASRHPLALKPSGYGYHCSDDDLLTTGSVREETYYGALPAELVRRYNIVWVVVDAARADHLSLFGYDRWTTPYLELLAEEAMVFSSAWAQSSATMLSMPSMFAGRNPAAMTWVRRGKRLSPSPQERLVSDYFRELGYATGIVTNWYFDKYIPGMLEGFEYRYGAWLDERRSPWFERSAPITTSLAIRFIEQHRHKTGFDDPFLLLAYYEAPHRKYYAHGEGYPAFGSGELGRYDSEIAYADRHVGFLLEHLKADPELWAQTVVVIVADHGEEFGEHGGSEHAQTCHRESVHVPLLLRVPGLPAAQISSPVALVDVLPTLLELVGAAERPDDLHGQSLLIPALGSAQPGRPIFCSVISQTAKYGNFFRRSVRVGGRALLHDVLEGTYELYDTIRDPGEHQDIQGRPAEAETLKQLRRFLDETLTGNLRTTRITG